MMSRRQARSEGYEVSACAPTRIIADKLASDGAVLLLDVLSGRLLTDLQYAYDEAVEEKFRSAAGGVDERHPAGWFEISRILERNRIFEDLMDVPEIVAAAASVLGPDLDLASAGELDYKAAHSETNFCGWHTDFTWIVSLPYPRQVFWVGCYFFIDEITNENGPLTVIPGTHRSTAPPPTNYNFERSESSSPQGAPRAIDGAIDIVGPAGSCLLINTEIWHMSRANRSDRARKLVKVHYKPPWMKVWGGGREYSDEFVARQTQPIRRQLVGTNPYDRVPWSFAPSASQILDRYPVASLLKE